MNKSIILALIIVIICFLAFFVRNTFNSNSSKDLKTLATPTTMPNKGIDRGIFLINQSSYSNTFTKNAVFYEIPKEYVVQSQGYKTSSSVVFALYELKSPTSSLPLSELCEQFKKDLAIGNEYTVCSTNGNLFFLGLATQQDKNILDTIVQSFAGEE